MFSLFLKKQPSILRLLLEIADLSSLSTLTHFHPSKHAGPKRTLAARAVRINMASTPPLVVCIFPPLPKRLEISKIIDTVPTVSIQKKKDLIFS